MKTTTTKQPKIIETFRRALSRGVPLIGLETPDAAASIRWMLASMNGTPRAVVQWDIIRGFTGANDAGQNLADEFQPELPIQNVTEALDLIRRKLPENGIGLFHNAHKYLDELPVTQAIWNARDPLKARPAMLVLMGNALPLPSELSQDVMLLSEEYPGESELAEVFDSTIEDAKKRTPTLEIVPEARPVAIDTLRGLTVFCAENSLAMSLSKSGIDQDSLWSRKAKMIENTPGLKIWRGTEKLGDIGGMKSAIDYATSILLSKTAPVRAMLFADEIEKQMAGASGDTSGTSQDQMAEILKFFNDNNIPILLLLGPGGTGKSMLAKACGAVAKCPVLSLDFGNMKTGLVGGSEDRIRKALAISLAVSDGKMVAVMTCNKIASLPPEFRRRCTLGTYFVDLPTPSERAQIWPIWIKKYGLTDAPLPEALCKDWTGAEIRAACDGAWRRGITLEKAAKPIIPIAISAPDQIDALRKSASGKYCSASYEGIYRYSSTLDTQADTGRKMEI